VPFHAPLASITENNPQRIILQQLAASFLYFGFEVSKKLVQKHHQNLIN
jgi:hypothetical protein